MEDLIGGRKQRWFEAGVSGVVGQVRTTRTVLEPNDLTNPAPPRNLVKGWVAPSIPGSTSPVSFGLVGEV